MKSGSKTAKAPLAFAKNYPEAAFETINRDNFLNFI